MSRLRSSKPLRAGRDTAGFTIVEVAIAAVLLALGALATLALVNAASHNNFRSSQSQVVNDRLQQEMEQIRALPYAQIALSGTPTQSTDPNNPNVRVSGTTFNVKGSGSPNYETLVYNGGTAPGNGTTVTGGAVNPGPTPFQSGNVNGSVYRYVTWEADPACGSESGSNCGERYYKRIVIAIALDTTASGGTRVYQEIQGYASNPNAGLPPSQGGEGDDDEGGGGPGPGDPGTPTPWTFWLTDTSCNFNTRQPIAGDHQTHNTLDGCATGTQSGSVPGAPDLMFPEATPCANGGCDNPQPQRDYATDVEPGCSTTNCNDLDKGLQELTPPDPTNLGCTVDITNAASLQLLGDTGQSTPPLYVHKWLSPAIPGGFSDVVLDGKGELVLWTQTVDNASYAGEICVWLFVRTAAVDVPVVNLDLAGTPTYFSYSQTSWPNTGWREIHVPLHFAAIDGQGAFQTLHLPAGSRLGVAVGVEGQGTASGTGLEFLYDHPSFDSRLEVDTHSVLPSF